MYIACPKFSPHRKTREPDEPHMKASVCAWDTCGVEDEEVKRHNVNES